MTRFGFSNGLDPTVESSRLGLAIESELLVRTLVTFRHVAGPDGLVPVPDLAKDLGHESPDGLTWVFHLKPNVEFGPPLDRPVYARDFVDAFRRIRSMAPSTYAYGSFVAGMAAASGIEDVSYRNGSTLVFHLYRPLGDLLYRLTLPAFGPIPFEVAGCFVRPGPYGRDLVSTGPYMIQGADTVDASSCARIRPMAGFRPDHTLVLVRNPDYDPTTDDQIIRSNSVRVIDIEQDNALEDILSELERGELDAMLGDGPVFPEPGSHRYRLHRIPLEAVEYLAMNVLVPPFDDVHVRRAVNLVLNRQALMQVFQPVGGTAAHQLFPPLLQGAARIPWPPRGALARARREMTLSAYDSNRDGECDAPSCADLLFIPPWTTPPEVNAIPIIRADLAAIGIHVVVRELDCMCDLTQAVRTVKNLVPLFLERSLPALDADPAWIAASLDSSGISCENQIDYSEIGMTEELADRCGVGRFFQQVSDHVPSLDEAIARCEAAPGEVRSACWAGFDRTVMNRVVPWAPLRFPDAVVATGPTVTHFEFDQAFGTLSLCHVAVATAGI